MKQVVLLFTVIVLAINTYSQPTKNDRMSTIKPFKMGRGSGRVL